MHVGPCIDLHPLPSTILPMSLTVALAMLHVATPPQLAAGVREQSLKFFVELCRIFMHGH